MNFLCKDALFENIFLFSKVYGEMASHITAMVDSENPKVYIGILHILSKFGPMPISHIGEKMDIAKPNMTLCIDGLVQKGWVKRTPSEHDRRIINIELTDEGEKHSNELTEKLYTVLLDKFSILSDEEREKVIESLNYLIGIGRKLMNK